MKQVRSVRVALLLVLMLLPMLLALPGCFLAGAAIMTMTATITTINMKEAGTTRAITTGRAR